MHSTGGEIVSGGTDGKVKKFIDPGSKRGSAAGA